MNGTAYSNIHACLQSSDIYVSFSTGKTSIGVYQRWVEQEARPMMNSLDEEQINLSARFPRDPHELARRALAQCHALDIVGDATYDEMAVQRHLAKISAEYIHDEYVTYIFPEESALLFSLVRNIRPQRAVFMGSYYGYWAASAKDAFPEMKATLLDLNPAVMDLAKRNFMALGLESNTRFVVGDAESRVRKFRDVDLVVLDTTGPKSDDVPADYRDKAIYYPHARAAFEALKPGGILVVHNVILSNFTNGVHFEAKQKSYRRQYEKFLPFVRERFRYIVVDTTEGMMVAQKL